MPRPFAVLALAFVCVGCQTHSTRYTILSTQEVDVSRLEGLTEGDQVKGSALFATVGSIPLSARGLKTEVSGRTYVGWNVDRAMDRALAETPGAVGMTDALVQETVFAIPFLVNYHACTVRGRPLIDPAKVPAEGSPAALARLDAADPPLP